MPAPHEDEIQLYGSVLNSIKMRLARVPPLLTFPLSNGKATIDRHQLEYAALQLRMTIESIALASLVANRRDLEAASIAFHRKDADAAGKVVKKLNPNYWHTRRVLASGANHQRISAGVRVAIRMGLSLIAPACQESVHFEARQSR